MFDFWSRFPDCMARLSAVNSQLISATDTQVGESRGVFRQADQNRLVPLESTATGTVP